VYRKVKLKMKTSIILPNVTLAAIVRDEKMNPAGGIEDFIHCHIPFVGAGVFVDTGSLDGTREVLEEMKGVYPNLQVHDHEFRGFADARNYSLHHVQTPYVLVLDADERLSEWDFKLLNQIMRYSTCDGFDFCFQNICMGNENMHSPENPMRLFKNSGEVRYICNLFEHLECSFKNVDRISGEILRIKHFLPSKEGKRAKVNEWYSRFREDSTENIQSPSQTPGFMGWKRFNPKRMSYHFGLPDYQFNVPESSKEAT
jgi:glycosyltransferase involved in cell wall biosynthesis